MPNTQYSVAYKKNVKEVESKLGLKQGKEMTFLEADEQRGNPNFSKGGGFRVNCQACVVANELRRRGFDVSAQENTEKKRNVPYELSHKTENAWVDKNGNIPIKLKAGGKFYDVALLKNRIKTFAEMTSELNELTKDVGRYHIDYVWKGGGGHIITLERLPNGRMQIFDPQSGIIYDWANLMKGVNKGRGINVLRVDDLFANTSIINGIVTK